jgi:hypothetical protein
MFLQKSAFVFPSRNALGENALRRARVSGASPKETKN